MVSDCVPLLMNPESTVAAPNFYFSWLCYVGLLENVAHLASRELRNLLPERKAYFRQIKQMTQVRGMVA